MDTTTQFTFSNGSGNGIHYVKITPSGSNGKYFQIITTGTSITIPNLAQYGFPMGSAVNYSWVVSKTMDLNSTDDFASQFFDLNPAVVATTVSTSFGLLYFYNNILIIFQIHPFRYCN